MIIIDDILPINKEEQNKLPQEYFYENNILKYKNNFWTGDVWKVIYELLLNYSDNIEEYNYYEHNNYRGIFTLKIKNKFNIKNINNYNYDNDFKIKYLSEKKLNQKYYFYQFLIIILSKKFINN